MQCNQTNNNLNIVVGRYSVYSFFVFFMSLIIAFYPENHADCSNLTPFHILLREQPSKQLLIWQQFRQFLSSFQIQLCFFFNGKRLQERYLCMYTMYILVDINALRRMLNNDSTYSQQSYHATHNQNPKCCLLDFLLLFKNNKY